MPRRGTIAVRSRGAVPPAEGEPRSPLRLTVTRGALGLELYETVPIGPLHVETLQVSLPHLRFPVDLSGGVPVFRHYRGQLEHLRLRVGFDALAGWARTRLREVPVAVTDHVSAYAVEDGIGFGMWGDGGALAFELLWVPVEAEARWVVSRPRAAGFRGVALALALQVSDTLFSGFATRRGRLFAVERAGSAIGKQVLPFVGARAPSISGARFSSIRVTGDHAEASLDSTYGPAALGPAAARAVELALLAPAADDALAEGRLEEARQHYLAALERAPRHPDVVHVIAEIDERVGGSAEASLSLLSEAMPVARAGGVAAELLARTGDLAGARDVMRQCSEMEEYPPLAAASYERLAELTESAAERLALLDEALSRCPAHDGARLTRLRARLEIGDVKAALSDAEHLEVGVTGARKRHQVCRRVADEFLRMGFVRDAGRIFERALRYVPDDPEATAGLGRALLQLGKRDRAVALLERAVELSDAGGEANAAALLDLSKVLSEYAGDYPQAIARAREVPASSSLSVEARALEARYRAHIGDVAGANLAYGRLREAVELRRDVDPRKAAEWLEEAATFASEVLEEPALAEQYLSSALRVCPHDARLAERYREAARRRPS